MALANRLQRRNMYSPHVGAGELSCVCGLTHGFYLSFSVIAPLATLTTQNVDVVFTATDPPFSTLGAYLSTRWHRARLVIDERDVYPDAPLAVGVAPPGMLVRGLSARTVATRRRQ